MAEELLTEMPEAIAELTLVPSSGGVFEVAVDGDLVFSKKAEGRHAEQGEVKGLIAQRME